MRWIEKRKRGTEDKKQLRVSKILTQIPLPKRYDASSYPLLFWSVVWSVDIDDEGRNDGQCCEFKVRSGVGNAKYSKVR